MDRLLRLLSPYHKIFTFSNIGFLIVSFIGILLIDNRWWWTLPIQFLLLHILIELKKDIWINDPLKKTFLRICFQVASLVMLLFVIPCIFVSAWWIFGLAIPVALYFYSVVIFDSETDVELSTTSKRRVWLTGLVVYIVLLCFYIVPSFIANNHKNPKNSFSSNYSNLVVESYNIYHPQGIRDREHIIPVSWYQTQEHFVNDPVNIIWSNMKANNFRGHLEFGTVSKSSSNEIRDTNNQIVGYRNSKYFMPLDEYKGDVARIMLYMYVTYSDDGLKRSQINVDLMKDWARNDPVDVREVNRNQAIQAKYGYNNRFVTFPRLSRFVV